jgi:outer membrane immunogenic protein
MNSQRREFTMRKLLLVTAAIVALMAGKSFAADLRAPVYKALPTPVFDWSGFYIGVDGGWQGSRIGLSNPDFGTLTYEPHHNSGAVGGFVGLQRQFGQIVLGLEGGYLAGFGQASLGTTTSISIFTPGGTGTAQAKLRDIWSVGGRVGWAAGNWMPYVTGGFANGSFQFDAQDSDATQRAPERARANPTGGYIGGGIDWAVTTNWIVGVEYRHYAFSAKTVTGVNSGSFTEPVRFAPSTDTIVGRLSYKFDWPLR